MLDRKRFQVNLLLVLVSVPVIAASTQSAELPPRVREHLLRYEQVTTFSISYSHHYAQSAETRAQLNLPADTTAPTVSTSYLVWQNGKIYSRRIDGGTEWKDNPKSKRSEFAFNGRVLFGGCPDQVSTQGRRNNPSLVIDLAADKNVYAEYFGVAAIDHIGVRLPHGTRELLNTKSLTSEILYFLNHGGRVTAVGTELLNGSEYLKIVLLIENPNWIIVQEENIDELEKLIRKTRTNSEENVQARLNIFKNAKRETPKELEYVYYLDPKNYSIRRWQERAVNGRLRVQLDGSDFKQLPGHMIWLPHSYRVDQYEKTNRPGEFLDIPFLTQFVQVTSVDSKRVSDEQFELAYNIPGTYVSDNTLPEAKLREGGVTYRIPANPEDLDRVISDARESARLAGEGRSSRILLKSLLIGVNVLAVLGLIGYFVRRRYR